VRVLNPGGSVKDRIGVRMVLEAEKTGRIPAGRHADRSRLGQHRHRDGARGAVRGYPHDHHDAEKMSREKQVTLEALGAEIIRTPTEGRGTRRRAHRRREAAEGDSSNSQSSTNNNNPDQSAGGTTTDRRRNRAPVRREARRRRDDGRPGGTLTASRAR